MSQVGQKPTAFAPRRVPKQIRMNRREIRMMTKVPRLRHVLIAIALLWMPPEAIRADPLVTEGIGISNCGRLASDLKPAEGLNNPVNLMLYSWVQGYVSAANVSMLESATKHVDISALDERKVISLVLDFCKANPDRKPVSAIDDYVRRSSKIKATWESGTVKWEE
jgi:hypothetical protein